MREAQATPTPLGGARFVPFPMFGVETLRGKGNAGKTRENIEDGRFGQTERCGFSLGGDAKPGDGRQFGNAERGVPDTSSDGRTRER